MLRPFQHVRHLFEPIHRPAGEPGGSSAARLAAVTHSPESLQCFERACYWQQRAVETRFPELRDAYSRLARSYTALAGL